MNTSRMLLLASAISVSLVGCSTGWPQARLATYLDTSPSPQEVAAQVVQQGVSQAGLVVINDTSAADSAPGLSPESLNSIKNHVQGRLAKAVPMTLIGLTTPHVHTPPVDTAALLQAAKDQGLNYLVLAVVSSTEIEVPDRLPLQGTLSQAGIRGLLVGYRAENYALAELAFVDVETGQPLLQADGQAWASLERLDVPLESNLYPVVRRDLEFPPIYPTKEAHAHDVLRAVASSDAINQAVMHFKQSWDQAKG